MFCPKCGMRGGDDSKFCRGCGVDLSQVMAVIDGKAPIVDDLSEKYIEVLSRGLRGLFIGGGLLAVGIVGYWLSSKALPVTLLALLMAAIFLGTGISRLVHAAGLRKLKEGGTEPASLGAGDEDYIRPAGSIYDTDDLAGRQLGSVTDRTTKHLRVKE